VLRALSKPSRRLGIDAHQALRLLPDLRLLVSFHLSTPLPRRHARIDAVGAQVPDGDDVRGVVEDFRGGFRGLGALI
jgi:hypothetical protein